MNTPSRKILLVVDGSYQAYETVNYASEVLPPSDTEIVLFHVTSKVPESFWDLEKDPAWQQKVQTVRGWEIQQERKIADFMERARKVFMNAGFPAAAVKVDVRERKEGIARDIGAESHMGYDSIILGRRGLSTIQDLSLGGVASKVVLKASDLAVWLIGARPNPDKMIIGIDTSEGSMLAIDHVARITDGLKKKILLLNVIRKVSVEMEGPEGAGMEEFQKARMEKAAKDIEPIMKKASERLQAGGISAENISTKVITGAITRAGSILDEARSGDYGTIVVGRRGLSTVEEFDMGRVSNKLVQAAKDRALWVVG
jgi:nucleotide-binding universal stress UspA family protein